MTRAASLRGSPARTLRRPPGRTLRRVAVITLLGALGLCAVTGWGEGPVWAVPLLAAVVLGSESAALQRPGNPHRWTFSLTSAALAASLALAPGAWTVLAVCLGVAGAQHLRHQPRLKREFAVAQCAAATAAAQAVAGLAGGGVAGACLGMTVSWLVGCVLLAVAVSATSRRPVRSLLASTAPRSALHAAGSSSLGLLAAHLAVHAPLGLLGLAVPLALLWSSYDQSTRRSAEARLFAELARGQGRDSVRSGDVSAQLVVTAAARLLGGADVELVLLASDGPVRYVGDETGVPDRRRVGPDVFDEPWVLRALGDRGVCAGRADGRPYVSAVLGDPDAPLAVLRAQRGVDAAAFDRDEVRLAQVLVGQAEAWLSVAELEARNQAAAERVDLADEAARALSDLGSATAPALQVLRESADRLARLATCAGGVDDVVEELHLVERAVASLLGAIALAAEPDLLRAADTAETAAVGTPGAAGVAPVRPPSDWTTTGVLT